MLMLHFLLNQTNLWVKLLFRSGVAVLASFSPLTFTGIPPLLTLFHSWTRQCSAAVRSQYTTILNNNKSYWIKMFDFFFLTVWCDTCICACVGCASCPCCCGSTDRHNLDGTGEAAFYRAPFCSGTTRSFGLGVTRQKPRATVRPEDRETVDTEGLSEFCIRRWWILLLPPRGKLQGAFHTWKAKVDNNFLRKGWWDFYDTLPTRFLAQDLLDEGCARRLPRLSVSSTSFCWTCATLSFHDLHFSAKSNQEVQWATAA